LVEAEEPLVDGLTDDCEALAAIEPESVDEALEEAPRSLPTGYVFICSKGTQHECEEHHVLGCPEREFPQLQKCIQPDTLLFLLNMDSLNLVGPFIAAEEPKLNIVPGAFNGRFKAQVRVTPCDPPGIREIQLERRIPGGPKTVEEVEKFKEWMLQPDEACGSSGAGPRLQEAWGSAPSPSFFTGASGPPSRGGPPSRPSVSSRPPYRPPYSPPPSPPPESPGGKNGGKKRKNSDRLNGTKLADADGRPYNLQRVVVNFANVGATYASVVLGKDNKRGDRLFDWEGVRRCIKCLQNEQGMQVIGVCFENYYGPDRGNGSVGIPDDIRKLCLSVQETPRLDGRNHKSADDEVTIKCAYRRNCRFLDNDNYRDWKCGMRDQSCRRWLDNCQEFMQMRYFFDSELGCFDVLDGNIPTGHLVHGTA